MNRRSELKTDPAKTAAWQERSQATARAKAMARKPTPSLTPALDRKARRQDRRRELRALRVELRSAWVAHTYSLPCPITGATENIDGHHVLEAQWIKQRPLYLGLTAQDRIRALYDVRNCLGVEHLAHLEHHAHARQGAARIPRAVVLERCPDILVFAAELGLEARFDRAYPVETT